MFYLMQELQEGADNIAKRLLAHFRVRGHGQLGSEHLLHISTKAIAKYKT